MLERALLSASALELCFTHAQTTNKEEIMGCLIGTVSDNEVRIYSIRVFERSDRKCDRVEIPAEVLTSVVGEMEELEQTTGLATRVVGWYHSHPKLTVWPSHVDALTQAQQQMLDHTFCGLIFSVFRSEPSLMEHVYVTCFQAKQCDAGGYEAVQIPLEIFDSSARDSLFQPTALTQLLQALVNEERALFLASRHSLDAENPDTSIVAFQNGLVFVSALTTMLQKVHGLIARVLEERIAANRARLATLDRAIACQRARLAAARESSV